MKFTLPLYFFVIGQCIPLMHTYSSVTTTPLHISIDTSAAESSVKVYTLDPINKNTYGVAVSTTHGSTDITIFSYGRITYLSPTYWAGPFVRIPTTRFGLDNCAIELALPMNIHFHPKLVNPRISFVVNLSELFKIKVCLVQYAIKIYSNLYYRTTHLDSNVFDWIAIEIKI